MVRIGYGSLLELLLVELLDIILGVTVVSGFLLKVRMLFLSLEPFPVILGDRVVTGLFRLDVVDVDNYFRLGLSLFCDSLLQ